MNNTDLLRPCEPVRNLVVCADQIEPQLSGRCFCVLEANPTLGQLKLCFVEGFFGAEDADDRSRTEVAVQDFEALEFGRSENPPLDPRLQFLDLFRINTNCSANVGDPGQSRHDEATGVGDASGYVGRPKWLPLVSDTNGPQLDSQLSRGHSGSRSARCEFLTAIVRGGPNVVDFGGEQPKFDRGIQISDVLETYDAGQA